jgi:two-component system, LytTR family, sensor kinase
MRARRLALYFVAWTAAGLFFFSQDMSRKLYFDDPTPWWHYFVTWLIGVWIAAALTPAIVWLGRRFPVDRRNWPRRIPLHLGFSFVFAGIDLLLVSLILPPLGFLGALRSPSFGEAVRVLAVVSFHGNVLSYWTVWAIQHAFRYYRRYQERETQLARAQLSALKGQLQPHFLFNTLNAIMVLVRQQRGRHAEDTLARLSDLLRCVLDDVDSQEVPLRRELEYVRLYLGIEQLRFQDRLRVDIVVDPAILDAALPHMALQPLVENAIGHGIGRRAAAGRIQIRAVRAGDTLEVRVMDDGPGFPATSGADRPGIGLANTRARLVQLYGDAARLTTENAPDGGAMVTLVVPYREVEGMADTEVVAVRAAHDAHR